MVTIAKRDHFMAVATANEVNTSEITFANARTLAEPRKLQSAMDAFCAAAVAFATEKGFENHDIISKLDESIKTSLSAIEDTLISLKQPLVTMLLSKRDALPLIDMEALKWAPDNPGFSPEELSSLQSETAQDLVQKIDELWIFLDLKEIADEIDDIDTLKVKMASILTLKECSKFQKVFINKNMLNSGDVFTVGKATRQAVSRTLADAGFKTATDDEFKNIRSFLANFRQWCSECMGQTLEQHFEDLPVHEKVIDSSGKFKDVWSNHECVQCFLKSDVSVTIERNNHGLTAQNTGWNSKLVAELRPLHTHIQVAMVTLVSKQGTFKFAVTGAASRGKNRDRAVNLALGLQILTNHRDLQNIDDEGNLDWMRKQFKFVDEHSEPLPDDSVSDHSSDKDGPATAAAARTVFDRLDSSDESIEDAPGAQGGQATEPKVPKPAAERSDEPKVPKPPRHAPSQQCYKYYYGHDTDTDVVPAKRRREDHPGESAEDSLELEAFEAWDDSEEKNESVRRVKKFINFSNENKLCWNDFSNR